MNGLEEHEKLSLGGLLWKGLLYGRDEAKLLFGRGLVAGQRD